MLQSLGCSSGTELKAHLSVPSVEVPGFSGLGGFRGWVYIIYGLRGLGVWRFRGSGVQRFRGFGV